MPIGKSAINRITNNGYSSVKTSAPDMENSTVLTNPSPEVIEKMIPSSKTIAPKAKKTASPTKKTSPKAKSAEKTATASSTKSGAKKSEQAKKKVAPKAEENTPKKVENTEEKNGFVYVNVGKDLPVHLL